MNDSTLKLTEIEKHTVELILRTVQGNMRNTTNLTGNPSWTSDQKKWGLFMASAEMHALQTVLKKLDSAAIERERM